MLYAPLTFRRYWYHGGPVTEKLKKLQGVTGKVTGGRISRYKEESRKAKQTAPKNIVVFSCVPAHQASIPDREGELSSESRRAPTNTAKRNAFAKRGKIVTRGPRRAGAHV